MISENQALELLQRYFGYNSFRPNQEAVIDDLLNGKDVVGIMPTGGGKSLCFQLPALMLSGTAIVISPLISLMKDQVDVLKANGIDAGFFNSSQSVDQQNEIIRGLHNESLQLLYIAPESLDHLLPHLKEDKICLFAIDEAHCISAWGHDFRPAYIQLGKLKKKFPDTPIAGFTATADAATQDDIIHQLNIPKAAKHIASFDRKNLYLEVRPGKDKLPQILEFLKNKQDQCGIIYCLSRKGTESLADKLNDRGYQAQAYHAGFEAVERSQIQDDFVNDVTPIIVATIAFGMGIDKSNVRWVIHYNLPKNIESYYQEIGRSGRDGLPAETLMFYSYADVVRLRQFAEDSTNKEIQLAKLERIQQYAEALSCRRIALLNYFGEHKTEDCGNCDICKTPPQFFDGTILTQKVCSAVYRLGQKEPIGVVIDVLRGAKNAQVLDKGYQHIKTYGVANDIGYIELQQYIIQMVNQGIISIRFHEKGRLVLTPFAHKVLFEDKKVKLASIQLKKKADKDQLGEGNGETVLFEKLRKLRKEISIEENVPAYIVFNDASLKDMENRKPLTEEEFAQVLGVGESKNKKYRERFISVIQKHLEQIQTLNTRLNNKVSTQQITFDLLEKGYSIGEVAVERELREETIYGHLIKLHQEGKSIDLTDYITQKEIEKIVKAKRLIEDDEDRFKPLFDHFEEKVPYWKLKMGLYLGL